MSDAGQIAKQDAIGPSPVRKWRRLSDGRAAILFLAPAMTLAGIFMVYPILNTIVMSFYNVDQFGRFRSFLGFRNYTDLFLDAGFRATVVRTLVWTAAVVITTSCSLRTAAICSRWLRISSSVRARA